MDKDRVFDSIIVITDRKVLDKQLQDTITSLQQVQGVVQQIDKNSEQLRKSLSTGKEHHCNHYSKILSCSK
jgi:type I restriction enzyme R subunit